MRIRSNAVSAVLPGLVLAAACDVPPAADAPESAPVEVDGPTVVEEVIGEVSAEYQSLELARVVDGLEQPWAIAFLADDRMLVSERPGRVQLVENGTVTEVEGLPEIHAMNQGGMLDLVPHPEYGDNGWIYMTYSKPLSDEETVPALARARLEGTAFVDFEELFESNEPSSPGRHYGSRILFLDDGTLLVTIGDRGGIPESAQDPETHTGTVVRLHHDGSVPDDNPFVDRPGYAPEIFTYGHRNIQGIVQHPRTGEIWATEHGPRGGDELNLLEPGTNYGWPDVSLGRQYQDQEPWSDARTDPGKADPVFEFLPTLAPSGLAVVDHDAYASQWQGNLLAGGLRREAVLRVVLEDAEVVHADYVLNQDIGRIRDVRMGPDGAIWVATGENDGGVYRLRPVD